MNINLKEKKTITIVVLLLVILVPILYRQISGLCTGLIAQYQASKPVTVQVTNPEKRKIYPEFTTTGRLDSKYSVNITARVDGWLQKRYFEEGDVVKKGQLLYKIEPDEYIFAQKNAQATVNENQAVYQNSQVELKRAKELLKQDFVSQEYYDNAVTTRNKNRALLDGSIEQLNKAKLNLSYTNIISPMDGRIGRAFISEGNYVTASSGAIATIYSTNPMKVNFVVKSEDYIMLKKHLVEAKKTHELPFEVRLKLSDGTIYDKIGTISFVDNKIDETTGSVSMSAVFDNPDGILTHGDYVNVILKLTKQYDVMLVPQSASKTDVGTGYYVWKVQDNKAVKQNILVSRNIDNNWVVENGLNYNDVIVESGIQSIYKSGQPLNVVSQNIKNQSSKENFFISILKNFKNNLKNMLKIGE